MLFDVIAFIATIQLIISAGYILFKARRIG